MKKSKLLSIVIFFTFYNTMAQSLDYIVTKGKDTIYGEIKGVGRPFDIKLKVGKEKKKYYAREIHGFFKQVKNTYYESVKSPFSWDIGKPNKKVFIKRLTKEGRIKLYYEQSGGGTTYFVKLFISKDGGKLKELPTGGGFASIKFAKKSTYEQLKPFLKDKNEILIELDSIESTKEAFVKLVNKYNDLFK